MEYVKDILDMKYIDAEKLKAEIEKHIKEVKDVGKRFTPNMGFFDAKLSGIYDVMSIIDSLQQEQQEEPDKDLEEAATHYSEHTRFHWPNQVKPSYDAFIAGAKWQAEKDKETIELAEDHAYLAGAVNEREQMMKGAVEGYVNYYEDSGGILMAEAQVGCPYHNGDKVKLIIIKDDGKSD